MPRNRVVVLSLMLFILVMLLEILAPTETRAEEVRTGHIEEPRRSPGFQGGPEVAAAGSSDAVEIQLQKEAGRREARGDASSRLLAEPTVPMTRLDTPEATAYLAWGELRKLNVEEFEDVRFSFDSILEPSVAGVGGDLLVTGNHFAALSSDSGETFRAIDPDRFFDWDSDEDFCCDQVAASDPSRGLLIWLAQSQLEADSSRGKSLRLAVSQGADRKDSHFWEYVLTPRIFGWSKGAWFDFSDLVVGQDFLYLMALLDSPVAGESASVVIRLPLERLVAYQDMDAVAFAVPGPYVRATRGAGREMVLAATGTYEHLWIWRWSETDPEPGPRVEVAVEPWNEPVRHGEVWLRRVDGSLMAAWAEGHHLGFAWTGGRSDAYPRPHVRVAILDRRSLQVVTQPHIWHATDDFAFPAVVANRGGTPGISLFYDGDDGYPGHAVGVLHEPCEHDGAWRWRLVVVRESSVHDNLKPWGDYLAIVPDPRDPDGWLAAGYAKDADGVVHPHLVGFALREGQR